MVCDEVDKGALELAVGAVLRLDLDVVDACDASKQGVEHVVNRGIRELFVDGRDIDRGDHGVFGQDQLVVAVGELVVNVDGGHCFVRFGGWVRVWFSDWFDNLCRLFSSEKDFNFLRKLVEFPQTTPRTGKTYVLRSCNFPAQTVFGLETTSKTKTSVLVLNNFSNAPYGGVQ